MTPSELAEAQHSLGLTNKQLADALRVSLRSIERWRAGDVAIPGPVEILITLWLRPLVTTGAVK